MTTQTSVDPASRSASQWAARLAALSRDRSSNAAALAECREALAYWRCHRVVERETGALSRLGVLRLMSELEGAAR